MPTRKDFPRRYFLQNPFDGDGPEQMYRRLRWGNSPRESWEVEGPEDMAALGTLAQIVTPSGSKKWSEARGPFLAVGVDSNWLYVVPRRGRGPIGEIPSGPYVELCSVVQTDYYSKKGNDIAYYYHEHEPPYPVLAQHRASGCAVILPQSHRGGRSYAVGEEGIIG